MVEIIITIRMIFISFFLTETVFFHKFCKSTDRNDRCFEFVGKIVDKIRAQQLRLLKLGGHFVKAFTNIADHGEVAVGFFDGHAHGEIARGEAVEQVNDAVDGL